MSLSRVIFILFVGGLLFFFLAPSEEEVVRTRQEESLDEEEEFVEVPSPQEKARPLEIKKQVIALKSNSQKSQRRFKYGTLDKTFASFDAEGNRYIEHINQVGKHLVYHGDVLIGEKKDLPRLLKNKVIKTGQPQSWPGGKIPYVIDESLVQLDQVMESIEYLNSITQIQIVPRQDEEDYVFLTVGESDCYSYVGRQGGEQEIFLTPRCGVREILHEWMHTIGFFHEQNREDRDQYLKVMWDNIADVHHHQFKKLPNEFIGLVGRPFDFQSIMLYSSDTFSQYPGEPALLTVDEDIIPRTDRLLSDEDIERINLRANRNQ